MENSTGAADSVGPESSRKENLLREFGDNLVQLGWHKPNTTELETQIDILRQHAAEDQIEGLTKAIERQIAGDNGCGCNRRSNEPQLQGSDEQPILTISTEEVIAEGYATPVATLKTAMWTGLHDDANGYSECFTPEVRADALQRARANPGSEPGCAAGQGANCCSRSSGSISGVRIWAEQMISAEEARLDYEIMFAGSAALRYRQPLRKVGHDWKISGPPVQIR
jgi:hypothetical protein